jgi:hypothetical protein
MRQIFTAFFSALAIASAGLVISATGCSSKKGANNAPSCDPSQCAAGNQCVTDVDGTMCRLVCADSTGCPFNYECALPQLAPEDGGAPTSYCVADPNPVTQKPGVWGTSCSPANGFTNNSACDTTQGFDCYAKSPTDGAAFCTTYDCADDTTCPGGWWCGTINVSPNATTTKRSTGATRNVCLPRGYCSPCTDDIDCSPLNGITQHCIADGSGTTFCSPECTSDSNCEDEAKCETSPSTTSKICFPRAGSCVGDGMLCAPCRSDVDSKRAAGCACSRTIRKKSSAPSRPARCATRRPTPTATLCLLRCAQRRTKRKSRSAAKHFQAIPTSPRTSAWAW